MTLARPLAVGALKGVPVGMLSMIAPLASVGQSPARPSANLSRAAASPRPRCQDFIFLGS